jgi:hypothetical protein
MVPRSGRANPWRTSHLAGECFPADGQVVRMPAGEARRTPPARSATPTPGTASRAASHSCTTMSRHPRRTLNWRAEPSSTRSACSTPLTAKMGAFLEAEPYASCSTRSHRASRLVSAPRMVARSFSCRPCDGSRAGSTPGWQPRDLGEGDRPELDDGARGQATPCARVLVAIRSSSSSEPRARAAAQPGQILTKGHLGRGCRSDGPSRCTRPSPSWPCTRRSCRS